VAITFEKLPEPIRITDPVNATFTEYHVYQDIVINIAGSTISSVAVSGLTPDAFVLREILQNAIDSEILKIMKTRTPKLEDFLWTYRKVKIKDIGKWKLVENEGTLDEDIFLFGYTTKEEEKKEGCRLIGRFGVGLKESIFVLLYQGAHILMAFGGHIYGFGYFYNGKVHYDLDLRIITSNARDIKPVILRGEYNVKDKVLVYVPVIVESPIPITYPHEKPYALSPGNVGRVYHNGLYSGTWGVPLDINVCNIETDQYRSAVWLDRTLMDSLEMIADEGMVKAFKEILLRHVVRSEKVIRVGTSYAMEYLFSYAKENMRDVLQKALDMAVEELAKMTNEKVIIVDRVKNIKSYEVVAIALPDIDEEYIENARSYLASKGYKVFSYSEVVSGKLIELYNDISEPTIPEKVRALIKLAEWLYSIGVEVMIERSVPGWLERMDKIGNKTLDLLDPIPGIFDLDVRVVKKEYNGLLTDSAGVTLKVGNKTVIILSNLDEIDWLLYVGIMLHELNHVYSDFEHGTLQWESLYYVLYMIDILAPSVTPYVANLIRLAVYNPELFLKVNNIKELPSGVLPKELIMFGECPGYIKSYTEGEHIICDSNADTVLKLINDNGTLKVEVVPL